MHVDRPVEKIVYVEKPVYLEKSVEVPGPERIVFRDREVPFITYVVENIY